jgi:hypothetical protein
MANNNEINQSNFHEKSSVQCEPNDRTINNQHQSDISYKTKLQQLNQSLLDQIDLLTVSNPQIKNELKETFKEKLSKLTLLLNNKVIKSIVIRYEI